MRVATLLWAPLLLGASPAQKAWDPNFDYTNLRPSDEELWLPLSQAQVSLEDAATLAKGADEGARVRGARLVAGEAAHWEIELWSLDAQTKRAQCCTVNVSAAEPKELSRTPVATEPTPWEALSQVSVAINEAASVAKSKLEEKLKNLRVKSARFLDEGAVHWELEVFGFDEDAALPRRWIMHISSSEPQAQRRILQDRFPGEPLRSGKPTLLPSGLWVYDFEQGDGATVSATSKVKVHYRLWLLDQTKLHDTWKDKKPETFLLSDAPLQGMIEGMEGMRVGGRRKIAIPYQRAFGEKANEIAPAKAMIVCDVRVESIEAP